MIECFLLIYELSAYTQVCFGIVDLNTPIIYGFARPPLERKIRHHRSLPAQGIIFPMGGDFEEVLKSRAKVCFPTHEKS